MQPGNNINNHELGDLLKTSFLELDTESAENSELMDKVSASVFAREWPESQVKQGKTSTAVISKGPWIWYLSAFLLLVGLSYGAWTYYKYDSAPGAKPIATKVLPAASSKVSSTTDQANEGDSSLETATGSEKNEPENNVIVQKPLADIVPAHHVTAYLPYNLLNTTSTATAGNLVASATSFSISAAVLPVTDTASYPSPGSTDSILGTENTAMPAFTEKEKEEHAKNIQQMLDNIAGLRFQDYSKIKVEDKNLNINTEFFLKRGEVTIRQYKLFLNDLLINGKKIEYEIARPKPELTWTDPKDRNNKRFLEQYFKKSTYDDYPVVCISPEGMELYCGWLKQEIEGYYKRNGKTVSLTVRLPYETEWKYAASEGKRNHRYGTAKGRIKARFGGAYLANFAESQRKFVAEKDTVLPVDSKRDKHVKDAPVTHKLSKYIFTAKASDYPSYFNLSNMSGNVSEVVLVKGEKGMTFRTIGGNWNSQKSFLKINAPDEFGGKVYASPYIGFRPVIMINN